MMAHDFESRLERARLAMTQLELWLERREYGLTDSDVLGVIDLFTTGACKDFACTSDICCDYQSLSVVVWAGVDELVKTMYNDG